MCGIVPRRMYPCAVLARLSDRWSAGPWSFVLGPWSHICGAAFLCTLGWGSPVHAQLGAFASPTTREMQVAGTGFVCHGLTRASQLSTTVIGAVATSSKGFAIRNRPSDEGA